MTHHITDEQIVAAASLHLGECVVESCGLGDIKDFARAVLALAAPAPAVPSDVLSLPKYRAWLYVKEHGEWPKGIDRAWMKDDMGRHNDSVVAREVIQELAAALTAAPTPPAQPEPMLHAISGRTADELWRETGRLRSQLADMKARQPAVPESADDAPPAPPEPEPVFVIEVRECPDCGHVGINEWHPTDSACSRCDWTGPSPEEDKCPGCGTVGSMSSACPECGHRDTLIAHKHVPMPAAQPAVPEDVARLDALGTPGWELSMNDDPECGPDELWQVHRVSGGRNDREWTLIGSGANPRAAIDAARAAEKGGA